MKCDRSGRIVIRSRIECRVSKDSGSVKVQQHGWTANVCNAESTHGCLDGMERNRIRSVGVRASKKEKKYEKNRLDGSFVLGIAAVARGDPPPASIEFIELRGKSRNNLWAQRVVGKYRFREFNLLLNLALCTASALEVICSFIYLRKCRRHIWGCGTLREGVHRP